MSDKETYEPADLPPLAGDHDWSGKDESTWRRLPSPDYKALADDLAVALNSIMREVASDPNNVWCRNALHIATEAYRKYRTAQG